MTRAGATWGRTASMAGLGILLWSCRTADFIRERPVTGFGPPAAAGSAGFWSAEAPLPRPLTNNAVAGIRIEDREYVFSFMGLDQSRSFKGIISAAFRYDIAAGLWSEVAPVPGGSGRLGATAQALRGKIYLVGGYTVGERLREVTVRKLDIYDPLRDRYLPGAPTPVPVDDTVSGVWHGRLLYLVSGWSGGRNVSDVQVYDPGEDRWRRATPIPGPPVFGHAGGIVGDTIVYCDGVRIDFAREPRYVLSRDCYRGEIDVNDPTRIAWEKIEPHPGRPRYRMAAGVLAREHLVVFTGGTGNPYNYDGIGYDGTPSRPSADTFYYDPRAARWGKAADNLLPTMDHRGLAEGEHALFLVGGMTSGRRVLREVTRFSPGPE